MLRFLSFLAYFLSFVLGVLLAIIIARTFFRASFNQLIINSAPKIVGLFGDKFPQLNTPFGSVQIKSKQLKAGQELQIACVECRLQSPLLGEKPFVTSDALLKGIYRANKFQGEVTVEGVSLSLTAFLKGEGAEANFILAETPIASLYWALRSIVPEAERCQIKGTLAGSGRIAWPKLDFSFKPDLKGFQISGLVDVARFSRGRFTYQGRNAQGERLELESGEGSPSWVPLTKVSPYLPQAIIAVEDRGFFKHQGFDLNSMLNAGAYNRRTGRVRRGGSTLSQQLAKNLFLSGERTYSRKLRELLYATELDQSLGKTRILELYVNIVEFGPGIYGIKDASRVYFGKSPEALLPEQAAWLASILRSPIRAYNSQFLTGQPQTGTLSTVIYAMSGLKSSERQEALSRPLVFGPQ